MLEHVHDEEYACRHRTLTTSQIMMTLKRTRQLYIAVPSVSVHSLERYVTYSVAIQPTHCNHELCSDLQVYMDKAAEPK